MKYLLLVCMSVQSWVVNDSSTLATRPEVHRIQAGETTVRVTSAGLSLHSFGALEANQYETPSGPRLLTFEFPAHAKKAQGWHAPAPLGIIGAFVTGVPIYNPVGTVSWQDQNIWHQDAVRASSVQSSLLASLNVPNGRVSPIIGYALDGFPIYGPFSPKRMRSSYQLRHISDRRSLPDGTVLTPAQEGPAISAENPLGTFAEDYEYVAGSGDLDEFNGHATDEGYGYYLSTWPYMVGPSYYGHVPSIHRPAPGLTYAGGVITLGLGARFLEKIHEQPIHLAVVSEDLRQFDHIHPQPVAGAAFAVAYTFPRAGKYWLYADFTKPGRGPEIERYSLTVKGPPALRPVDSGVAVRFTKPPVIRAGEDVALSFALPVNDLEPWLGAWAHIMIVSYDKQEFVHAHPLESVGLVHSHVLAGPSPSTIRAVTGFRTPGMYKLWFQYQRDGKVNTVPFVVRVAPALKKPQAEPAMVQVSARGFEPARLTVTGGTRITFTRTDARSCAREVVFPELGIRAALPLGKAVGIDVPASAPAELHFACGMGMFRGSVVVTGSSPGSQSPYQARR